MSPVVARMIPALLTDAAKPAFVKGRAVEVMCVKCQARPVLMVYHRLASGVMFCQQCGSVWTVSSATK